MDKNKIGRHKILKAGRYNRMNKINFTVAVKDTLKLEEIFVIGLSKISLSNGNFDSFPESIVSLKDYNFRYKISFSFDSHALPEKNETARVEIFEKDDVVIFGRDSFTTMYRKNPIQFSLLSPSVVLKYFPELSDIVSVKDYLFRLDLLNLLDQYQTLLLYGLSSRDDMTVAQVTDFEFRRSELHSKILVHIGFSRLKWDEFNFNLYGSIFSIFKRIINEINKEAGNQ